MLRVSNLKLGIDEDISLLKKLILKKLKIKENELIKYFIYKESIDARKRGRIDFVYTVDVVVKNEDKLIKKKLKIDDALDAFGCHGIGGIWGGIATGIFGKSSINPVAKWDGLIYGEWRLFIAQIEGILITIAIAVVGTLICVAIVRIFTPLRVTDREEKIGLDISQHGESAYPSFNGMDQ